MSPASIHPSVMSAMFSNNGDALPHRRHFPPSCLSRDASSPKLGRHSAVSSTNCASGYAIKAGSSLQSHPLVVKPVGIQCAVTITQYQRTCILARKPSTAVSAMRNRSRKAGRIAGCRPGGPKVFSLPFSFIRTRRHFRKVWILHLCCFNAACCFCASVICWLRLFRDSLRRARYGHVPVTAEMSATTSFSVSLPSK